MGADRNSPLPRKLDEFETGLDDMLKHSLQKDSNDERWYIDQVQSKLRVESATQGPPARATFRLLITPAMSNSMGNLHGGCTATIIDILTSILVMGAGQPGMFQYGGVSRNLNVTYLRPLPVNTEIHVICEVTQIGKRLAFLRAEIRRVDDDVLCAVADHQKANTDPPSNQKL